jgi:hypothetical protein
LLSEVSALFITTLHPSVEAAGGDVEGEHILAPVLQRQTRPGGTGADVEHTSRSQVEGDVRVSREVLDGVDATDEAVRTLDQLVRGDRDSTRFLTGPRTSPKVPIVSCFVWTRSFTIGRRWRRHWSTQPDFRPPQSTSVVRSRRRTSAVTPFRLTTSAPLPGRGEFAFADGDPRSGPILGVMHHKCSHARPGAPAAFRESPVAPLRLPVEVLTPWTTSPNRTTPKGTSQAGRANSSPPGRPIRRRRRSAGNPVGSVEPQADG